MLERPAILKCAQNKTKSEQTTINRNKIYFHDWLDFSLCQPGLGSYCNDVGAPMKAGGQLVLRGGLRRTSQVLVVVERSK